MAPKRPSPFQDSPAASSSEEEDTTSGGEDDALLQVTSSEEEEKEKVDFNLKKSAPLPSSASATAKKVAFKKQEPPMMLQAQESSLKSGSGSGSESDAEAQKNVKPAASKTMEGTPKRQKQRENADMTVRSPVKRPSQSRETKTAKKGSQALFDAGAVTEHDSKKNGDESKKLFQRLWSEEDEIVILKGLSDFTAKKGFEPAADMNDFHDFIKKDLHVEASLSQLRDKVRRLKKKYTNNVRRGKKGGDPTFTKPHERKAFELAKKAWGNEIETAFTEQPWTPRKSPRASSRKSLKEELQGLPENVEENDSMDGGGTECLNELLDFNKVLPENMLKRGLAVMEGSKKAELAERWKRLHYDELELFVRRTELVGDQARMVMVAYKPSSK